MITYKIYCITNMITHEHYSGGYHWEYLDEKGGCN